MTSDIHKKLVFGALGCGGLLVIGFAAALYFGWHGFAGVAAAEHAASPRESQEAWDSLSVVSPTGLFAIPPLPEWQGPPRAPGSLQIMRRTDADLPSFADTFPAGSKERKDLVLTAQRVVVLEPGTGAFPGERALPTAAAVLFRARILFAAADDWSHHGDPGEAVIALDSALALARAGVEAPDLEHVMVGARVERDAMDLLSRDTTLAGGPANAAKAGAAVGPLGRAAARLENVDRWMMAAGASSRFIDSLALWAADPALPVPWRTVAVDAIGMGWVFSSLEPGTGVLPARGEALQRLRSSSAHDFVAAEVDRITAINNEQFADRMKTVGFFRAQRFMLFLR